MTVFKIKPQHQFRYIAFGALDTSGKVLLKDRTQRDLRQLAKIGLQSGDKTILDLFEGTLPTLASIQKQEIEEQTATK